MAFAGALVVVVALLAPRVKAASWRAWPRWLVASAAVALAAVTAAPVTAAQPRGELTQLRGKAGCVSESGAEGCGRARELALAAVPAAAAHFVTVSPDGRNVYAAGGAVVVFSRERRTGRLTQLSGTAGCVRVNGAEAGCATARGLALPGSVAVSPDGRSVYVTSGNEVLVFARDRRTGALSQLAGEAGCVSWSGLEGCALARGAPTAGFFAGQVVVTSDGRSVYVAAPGGGVLSFARDGATGALSQLPGDAGCVGRAGVAGCAVARAIETPFSLATSLAGGSIYVVEPNEFDVTDASGVAVFGRKASTGVLTQLPGEEGCLSNAFEPTPGCARARALVRPGSVTVSPDGRSVFVPGGADQDIAGEVAVLARNQKTGALQQPSGKAGCLSVDPGLQGCRRIRVIFYPGSVAVSPDGRNVYLGGGADASPLAGAVTVLARSRRGKLAQLSGSAGCVRRGGGEGCNRGRALNAFARSVAVTPNGRNVYVASGAAIAVFARCC